MLLNLNPHSVIAVGVLLPSIASIATCLRFYGRHRLRVPLREDDWTTLVSVVLVWGLGITNIAGRFAVSLSPLPICMLTSFQGLPSGHWVRIRNLLVPMTSIRIPSRGARRMRLRSR